MRIFFYLLLCPLFTVARQPAGNGLPPEDSLFSAHLSALVARAGLEGSFDVGEDGSEQISLAVIDLCGREPRLGGVGARNFIYPASVYKMYVAAEVLEQVSNGEYSLWTPVWSQYATPLTEQKS